jgi:hypothetical protein
VSEERAFYRNNHQKSANVIRMISSQLNMTKKMTKTTLITDTETVQKTWTTTMKLYPNSQSTNKKLKAGFIHDVKTSPYGVTMYIPRQVQLAAKTKTNLYLDVTGGLTQKANNGKQINMYSAIAEFPETRIEATPVFEETLNSTGLSNQLAHWFREFRLVNRNRTS